MMWTRKELKERAKEALKRNYWKIVLVSLIGMLIGGDWAVRESPAAEVISVIWHQIM